MPSAAYSIEAPVATSAAVVRVHRRQRAGPQHAFRLPNQIPPTIQEYKTVLIFDGLLELSSMKHYPDQLRRGPLTK